jgi:DNA-binding NtrC family response regulator
MRRAKLPDVKQFSCVDCGAPATDYEHRYYSLPLEVDPVCSLCNQRRDIALDVVEMVRERRGLNAEDQRDEPEPHPLPLDEVLDSAERKFITEALRINHGNSAAAARYLGIKYRSMRHRLSRLQIGNSPLPAHKPPSKL